MKLHPNIKYRTDIDGLRAIAVLSVIFFHINSSWVPGGFLGVDIFFVISGYLITLILAKEVTETHKINITNFYKRRIKRIIPALLFVLFPTFLVGFFILTPDALEGLSESMLWSFFSAANIYFYSSIDTGYFATGSSELPLLHLWSLGVEEQFYILWPFSVLLLLKYIDSIKKILFISGALFMASLILAQITIVDNHSFAYYLLPTRAWELLAGAMVALLVHSGFKTKHIVNEIIAALGLLAILLSLAFVTKTDPVPGIAAFPAIAGASLLILSGISHRTYVGKLLSLKLFVAIGIVSYSSYLWHWPILAYLRYALIDIDLPVSIAVIMLTFIMAVVSYFFIEKPLRTNNASTKNVFIFYFLIPGVIIVTTMYFIISSIEKKESWIFPWERLNTLNTNTLPAGAFKYNCQFSRFNVNNVKEKRCSYPENIEKTDAILIGDSNAAHYLGMLRVFAAHYNFSLKNLTHSSCPFVLNGTFDWMYPVYKKSCQRYRKIISNEAMKYNTIIIGENWPDYLDRKNFKPYFEKTIDSLASTGKTIILLGKVPVLPMYNKDCEIRSIKISTLKCKRRFDVPRKKIWANLYIKNISEKYENVFYFDIGDFLCKNNICSAYIQGEPLYYNSSHLSMKGSEKLGKLILDSDYAKVKIFQNISEKQKMKGKKSWGQNFLLLYLLY